MSNVITRAAVYSVFVKKKHSNPLETAQFVKEGFSFPAFFLTLFWAAYHRMWSLCALLVILNVALGLLEMEGILSNSTILIIQFFVQLLLGFEGNDLLQSRLKERGYILADIVSGQNAFGAQQRFFDRYFARQQTHGTSLAVSPWSKLFTKPTARS